MEIPGYNQFWIKNEPEEIENDDENDSMDCVDPLMNKPEEEEEDDAEVLPVETVRLESCIVNENTSGVLEKDVHLEVGVNKEVGEEKEVGGMEEEEEEEEEENGVEEEVEGVEEEVEGMEEEEEEVEGMEEEEEEEEKEKDDTTNVPDDADLNILYPKVLIKNDKPNESIKELNKEEKSSKNNEESDPIAKSGVLIHCPECNTVLRSNSELKSHREICSSVPTLLEKPPTPVVKYPEFCEVQKAHETSVVRQRIRSKNKPKRQPSAALFQIRDGLFWCTQCNYKTASDAGLRHHRRAHQEKLESFKCGFCDYGCSRSRDLERHLRTHTGEKPYKCEICGYTCANLSNLKRHTMRHTGELPYACTMCEFRCARSGTLEIHERTHNKQKPYQCRLCSRAFAAASSLKRHEGMHAEVGHLVCDSCDYRCGQMHLLKRHMKRHEREKSAGDGGELRQDERHATFDEEDNAENERHATFDEEDNAENERHAAFNEENNVDHNLSLIHGLESESSEVSTRVLGVG